MPSSALRPGCTSRLLSCPKPVGGLRLAVPARSRAKLRSNKSSDPASRQQFRAGSLQSTCRIFGNRTCVMCHQIGLCQTPGRLCPLFAERTQEMGNQSDAVMSGVVDSGRECGHGNIDANDRCCRKSLFALLNTNFPSRRCGDPTIVWGGTIIMR